MEEDQDEDEVLEEDNGWGQEEEEEEEEQQHPFQQDHVDVTNFLHCRFPCVATVNIHRTPSSVIHLTPQTHPNLWECVLRGGGCDFVYNDGQKPWNYLD
jgi:hypothetical protein